MWLRASMLMCVYIYILNKQTDRHASANLPLDLMLPVYHMFFSPSLLGTRTCKPFAVRLKTLVTILTYTDTYDHILVYM